tara:strand:- start:368 stop:565 length:198 start_codon:yes stop_codon:yes gene_type:complete
LFASYINLFIFTKKIKMQTFFGIHIDQDLKNEFKAAVSRKGLTIRETVISLMKKFIDESKQVEKS